jgi:hypothetical protein
MSAPTASPDSAALARLFQLPLRRATWTTIASAVAVAAGCWYFGTSIWYAAMIGAGLGTLGLAWLAVPTHRDAGWKASGVVPPGGARRDIQDLSWLILRGLQDVDPRVLQRVYAVAQRRLSPHGLDLGDPRDRPGIERLLGAEAYATLRPGARPARFVVLERCLSRLEHLPPSTQSGEHGASRDR